MRHIRCFISLFVVVVVVCIGASAGASAPADAPYIAKFYAPWCGACNSFAPEWSAFEALAAKKYPSLNVVSVDCTTDIHKQRCAEKYKIEAYPTVKFVARAGDAPVEYRGAQTAGAMDAWVGQLLPTAAAAPRPSACRTLRKVLKRIITNDAGCELSFHTTGAEGAGGVLSCAFDVATAVRAALDGRKIDSPLVRDLAALTSAVVSATGGSANDVVLDLEQATSGLLFVRLPTVTVHTLLCIF